MIKLGNTISKEINILQIGYGYWGPNLTRNLANLPDVRIAALGEIGRKNIDRFRTNFPGSDVYEDYREGLNRDDIHAVVVATPAAQHFEMTRNALEHGKHVLVEKPLALSSEEGKKLVDIAHSNNCVLMVGHTFLYNSAVRKIKEYIDSGELGKIYYIYSHRLNLGKIRQDINALWNFAPHDISIILYLLENRLPQSVTARGYSYIQNNIEDVAFMTMEFENSVCAHIHVSWIDPNKVRKMTIVGSKKMIVYDDVSIDAKIKVFDKGVDKKYENNSLKEFENYGEFQLLLRAGDVSVPRFDFVEPLKEECKHFVECIRNGKSPLTSGDHGVQVIKILENAERSIKNAGAAVTIPW
jgi:predicted dehydrogenase